MARDGYQDRLTRDALVSGRGAYPESDGYELAPDVADSRLLTVAQWIALAAGIVMFLAGIVTAGVIADSYDWGETLRVVHGMSGLTRNGAAAVVIVGVVVAAFVGVLLYTVARGLFAHPCGGAIVFFAVAGIVAAFAVVLLLTPDLVLGDAGNAAAWTARASLSDAQFAGLALLAGAALAAAAGGLTTLELAGARKRAREAEASSVGQTSG